MTRICDFCRCPVGHARRPWAEMEDEPALVPDFLSALARACGRERGDLRRSLWLRTHYLTVQERWSIRELCRNRIQYVTPAHMDQVAALMHPELPGGIVIRLARDEQGIYFHPRHGRRVICSRCSNEPFFGTAKLRAMMINHNCILWE